MLYCQTSLFEGHHSVKGRWFPHYENEHFRLCQQKNQKTNTAAQVSELTSFQKEAIKRRRPQFKDSEKVAHSKRAETANCILVMQSCLNTSASESFKVKCSLISTRIHDFVFYLTSLYVYALMLLQKFGCNR